MRGTPLAATPGGTVPLDPGVASPWLEDVSRDGQTALVSTPGGVVYRLASATGTILGQVNGRPHARSWRFSADGREVIAH